MVFDVSELLLLFRADLVEFKADLVELVTDCELITDKFVP